MIGKLANIQPTIEARILSIILEINDIVSNDAISDFECLKEIV